MRWNFFKYIVFSLKKYLPQFWMNKRRYDKNIDGRRRILLKVFSNEVPVNNYFCYYRRNYIKFDSKKQKKSLIE